MNCLSTVLDECLDLFFSMLSEPRFDAERLDLAKQNELESLKQRNDNPVDVRMVLQKRLGLWGCQDRH